MLTLIKREIYDHIVYFVGAIIFSFLMITIIVSIASIIEAEAMPVFAMGLSTPVILFFLCGSTGMGVSQMYADRNKKISAFISTLPVTRSQILIARIITGILAISTFFLPLVITTIILYQLSMTPIPFFKGILLDIYTASLLIAIACYCIGLQTGWTTSKLLPTIGGLFLACLLVPIIIIKGFDSQVSLLLIIFIVASLIRIRQKFMSTSL